MYAFTTRLLGVKWKIADEEAGKAQACSKSFPTSKGHVADEVQVGEVTDDLSEVGRPYPSPEYHDARPTELGGIVLRSSKLLNLPAEIRICIYMYTLIEDKPIAVMRGHKLPALLSTCHQIRREGLKAWFADNEFDVLLINCDATLFRTFRKLEVHAKASLSQTDRVIISLRGFNWGNLMKWCFEIFDDPASTSSMQPAHNDNINASVAVVCAAHQITLNVCQQSTWREVKAQLNALRMVAGKVDKEWLR
ncbi:hypothetical protein LTR37_001907 [Vermiconidia calcicola]|uniref:Uncharacterized protein n=1 Tax=Vermiconidia calcicola TaxID=1690605 RepID=A0ACC3NUH2_9PEZI|nr:hypothetical protein LTR37_001907 [Vermiconidia calcicola]